MRQRHRPSSPRFRAALAALSIPIVGAFLIPAWAPPADAAEQDALARIKKQGVLHVANSGVYPPFEFVEDGKLVGFDVDLTRMIAAKLGVKPDIQMLDFKGLIPSLKSGKVDVLVSALTYTKDRAEQIAFSEPYYRTAIAVAVRDDHAPVTSKAGLSGKRLGAEIGTTGEREAHASGAADVKTYDTLMLALRDLENGRLDGVISTLPPLQYLIHRNFPHLKVTLRYNEGWVGVNTRKEDKNLLAAINGALDSLRKDGSLSKLQIRWFGEASPANATE